MSQFEEINWWTSMIADLEKQNVALRLELHKKNEEIDTQLREVGRLTERYEQIVAKAVEMFAGERGSTVELRALLGLRAWPAPSALCTCGHSRELHHNYWDQGKQLWLNCSCGCECTFTEQA